MTRTLLFDFVIWPKEEVYIKWRRVGICLVAQAKSTCATKTSRQDAQRRTSRNAMQFFHRGNAL